MSNSEDQIKHCRQILELVELYHLERVYGIEGLPPDRRLRMRLFYARDVFSADDGGREGAIAALEAVVDYVEATDPAMREAPRSRGLLEPLRALHNALVEATRGVQVPMLRPSRADGRRGRPPNSGRWSDIKALCAAAVTIGMRFRPDDEKEREIAARVSRRLARAGMKQASGKPIAAITIENWRQEIMEGVGSDCASLLYSTFTTGLDHPEISDEEKFEAILSILTDEWFNELRSQRKD